MLIDNVAVGTWVTSPRLEATVTMKEKERIGMRTLGKSELPYIHNRSTIFITGNQLRLGGELPRRSLMITLDPNTEHPETRAFDLQLPDAALEQFPALVMNVIALAARGASSDS